MYTKASRSAALTIASLLTMAVSAAIWAQATAPAASGPSPQTAPGTNATPATAATTPSATATARPGVSKTARMAFHFQAATIDEILSEMSQRFGFIVVQSAAIGQRVTINVPNPVDADEAIRLVNSALYSLQYATVESSTGGDDAKTVLRIVSVLEAKKSQIPVREGADANKIPLDDTVITQIIPLKNLDAARTRSDLAPMISSDADVTSNPAANAIIITDTSAKIHRLVEIIQKLDNQRQIKNVTEYRVLSNSNATDAATLLNNMFNPTNTGQTTATGGGGGGGGAFGVGGATGAAPGGGRGGGGARGIGGGGGGTGSGLAAVQGRLYATADTRTNTVLITGPAEQVSQAAEMLAKIEAIPINVLNNSVFFIKHLKNANCSTISPVLNQIFGTSGNTGNTGTANRTTTNTLSFTSSNNRTSTGGAGGGRTTGAGGGGGTTGRGGDVDESLSGAEAGGTGGGAGGRGGGAGGGGGGGLGGGAGGGAGGRGNTGGTTNRAGTGTTGNRNTTNTAASALSGAAYFVPNADTNSLLVTTDKNFEDRVRGIIDELDRPVPQVLIKALVCEVTHTNGDDVGFEFGVNNDLRTGTDINGNAITLGLLGGSNFGIAQSGGGFKIGLVESQVQATLRALANQNKLEVLSRPYILTQDNQEAYIWIGQNIPYITSSQVTNTGQTINSVSYTQVGIVLDVWPHVNPDGLVTMTVGPQVSQLDAGSGVPISSNVNAPTFTTRQAYANVAIRNGETIVIGGLMQDQNQQIINKIPILGDIPYLGMLFKRTTNQKIKTELLVFITPHVAMTPDVLQKMSDEETQGLKLVPNAVQPGTWEQQMRGMEAGATTTQPQREIRIERGNLTPQP